MWQFFKEIMGFIIESTILSWWYYLKSLFRRKKKDDGTSES